MADSAKLLPSLHTTAHFVSKQQSFLVLVLLAAASSTWCSTPGDLREKPKAEYNAETGRLQRLAFDATRNGRNDAVGVMDGTRVFRIEVDEDEDGTVDRWDFYDDKRHLEKVGFSRQDDGVMDAIAYYGADEIVMRMELSTRRDTRFNRTEFYEGGVLARVEEDTNDDGRVDKWETYRADPRPRSGNSPATVAIAAFDDAHRGTPTRRLVYRPDGTVLRAESDVDGDGVFVDVTSRAHAQ